MFRREYLGLSLGICLLLSGCGGGSSPPYKYRIAIVPKGLTHEFWQSIHRGAQRAAADLGEQGIGVQIIWDGPAKESEALEQINIVNRNIASRVHGLVLAPQHSQTMVVPVEKAVQAGIPVVIIDSGLNNEEIIVKYISTDNYHGGWMAAEHLLKILREAGRPAPRLVLFRYQVGSESTEQREKGFEDCVSKAIEEQKKAGQPTITWLSRDKYAGATKDSAQREAAPLLNSLRDKEIDGIFAVNESAASGMLEAMRSLGLNKKVHLMGFDSSAPLLQAVRDGDVDGLIVQDPYRMGYLGAWTVVQHLEGHDVAPQGKRQSTGEYLVTKDNLDAPETVGLFDREVQAKRKIETPSYRQK